MGASESTALPPPECQPSPEEEAAISYFSALYPDVPLSWVSVTVLSYVSAQRESQLQDEINNWEDMIRKCNEWEAYLERKKASASSSRQKETQKRFYPNTTTSKTYQISKATENNPNHGLLDSRNAQANEKVVIVLPYYFLDEMGNASKAVRRSIPYNADPKVAWDRDISIFTHPISYFAKRSITL